MATKNKYVTAKLDWAEGIIKRMEKYLEDNPYDQVQDRIRLIEKKDGKGIMPVTAATIEQQQKNQRDTMKEYLELLAVIKKLRIEEEESSTETTVGYAGVKESIRMRLAGEKKDDEE